jgi:hypothetical protein
LDAHRRKRPESPADQNNVEHQRRKISFEDMNECMKKHGGHPTEFKMESAGNPTEFKMESAGNPTEFKMESAGTHIFA